MFCKKTQEYFAEKGIKFDDRNVAENDSYLKEVEDLGFATTPVILIDGEAVVGFDRKRLDSLLDL